MPIYAVLSGIDPRLTWPGMLVLITMLLAGAGLRLSSSHNGTGTRRAAQIAAIALGAAAAAQLLLALRYFFYPRYTDWMEPMVVAASWIGWHGGHFYPALTDGDVMGNWYGPLLYQFNGFFLWLLGPSIFTSKILGIAVFIGEQFLTFWMLRRIGARRGEAFALACVQCLLQAGFVSQGIAFGARADGLLLLSALCGVIAATSAPNWRNAAILGVLMGVAANLKIHGVFYLVPAFGILVSQADNHLQRLRLALVTGAAALASLFAPFALEGDALTRYIALFGLTGHHGISKWILEKNIVFLAMLWSPFVLLHVLFRPKLPPALLWFMAAAIPSMAVVTVAGSVEGSGPYNLLSFIPALCWALVVLLQAIRAGMHAENRMSLALPVMSLAFLIGYAPMVAMSWGTALSQFSDTPKVRAALAELEAQMKANPGRTLEVGPGAMHDLRVIPVFHGSPLPIDAESWADLRAGGVSEALPRKTIAICRVDYWLMPAGSPIFSDAFDAARYSPGFLAEFHQRYVKDASGPVFDRWRCAGKG